MHLVTDHVPVKNYVQSIIVIIVEVFVKFEEYIPRGLWRVTEGKV